MSITNISFVICTKNKSSKKTLLETSISKECPNLNYDIYRFDTNDKSLSAQYNKFIDESLGYYDDSTAIVFVHDDVYINCGNIDQKLDKAFEQFDVVGVAGTTTVSSIEHGLWHLMGPPESRRGCVAHCLSPDSNNIMPYMYTSFGPLNERVLLIDGVFIATTPSVLESCRFSEDNPSRFHYYDLDFSLECNKNKKKIGVWDIPIVHKSPGLTNPDNEWEAGKKWFLEKWS
jgi:glycosyltransferase involved in cell wall biosynthesis